MRPNLLTNWRGRERILASRWTDAGLDGREHPATRHVDRQCLDLVIHDSRAAAAPLRLSAPSSPSSALLEFAAEPADEVHGQRQDVARSDAPVRDSRIDGSGRDHFRRAFDLAAFDPTATIRFALPDTQVREATLQERLMARLSAIFSGVALLLAIVGLYGVVSYGVASRRAEIGVALGASRERILSMILRDVGRIMTIGIVAGGMARKARCRPRSGQRAPGELS